MIDTPRLHLRPHRIDDLAALHALTEAPEMRAHLGSDPPSIEDSFARLLKNAGGWSLYGYGIFAVTLRASGAPIGNCGLFPSVRGLGPDFDHHPEGGWIIAHDYWGQGYATEAITAVIQWFEKAHGPRRTVCMIGVGNKASERSADKLGYKPFRDAQHKGDAVRLYERGP